MKVLKCLALYLTHATGSHAENERRAQRRAFMLDAIAYVEEATVFEYDADCVAKNEKRFSLVVLKDKAAYYVIKGPTFEEIVKMLEDA